MVSVIISLYNIEKVKKYFMKAIYSDVYKENGGMHTAHNVAYENIHTELNVCIDSDDCLAIDAVEKIIKKWESVCDKGYVDCIHYCSSSQIAKNKRYINESPKKLLTVLCTPLGYMLTRYIHYKVKVDKRLTF